MHLSFVFYWLSLAIACVMSVGSAAYTLPVDVVLRESGPIHSDEFSEILTGEVVFPNDESAPAVLKIPTELQFYNELWTRVDEELRIVKPRRAVRYQRAMKLARTYGVLGLGFNVDREQFEIASEAYGGFLTAPKGYYVRTQYRGQGGDLYQPVEFDPSGVAGRRIFTVSIVVSSKKQPRVWLQANVGAYRDAKNRQMWPYLSQDVLHYAKEPMSFNFEQVVERDQKHFAELHPVVRFQRTASSPSLFLPVHIRSQTASSVIASVGIHGSSATSYLSRETVSYADDNAYEAIVEAYRRLPSEKRVRMLRMFQSLQTRRYGSDGATLARPGDCQRLMMPNPNL